MLVVNIGNAPNLFATLKSSCHLASMSWISQKQRHLCLDTANGRKGIMYGV